MLVKVEGLTSIRFEQGQYNLYDILDICTDYKSKSSLSVNVKKVIDAYPEVESWLLYGVFPRNNPGMSPENVKRFLAYAHEMSTSETYKWREVEEGVKAVIAAIDAQTDPTADSIDVAGMFAKFFDKIENPTPDPIPDPAPTPKAPQSYVTASYRMISQGWALEDCQQELLNTLTKFLYSFINGEDPLSLSLNEDEVIYVYEEKDYHFIDDVAEHFVTEFM